MDFSSLIVKPRRRSAIRERSETPDSLHLSALRRFATPETIQHNATQGRAPTPKSVSFAEEMDVDSTDSQSEDEEDEESEGEIVKLIPKPKGEAGRPGSGGYSLQEVLAWSEKTYETVVVSTRFGHASRNLLIELYKDFVHEKAKKKRLDLSKSYSKQDKKLVKEICEEVRKEYRILDDYKNYWPVHDMLKLHLKYTSEAARRAKTASATKKIDKVSLTVKSLFRYSLLKIMKAASGSK